jgi:hypothetical protein
MKVAIIGAGLYGCHITERLISLGIDVVIFEKNDAIFKEASSNNQFRLHQGFHYARNFRTRQQSRDGFYRFIERYGEFTQKVKENIYSVPRGYSLIDFKTYKLIMMSSGLDFKDVPTPSWLSQSLDSILVDERTLLVTKLKNHFSEKLKKNLRLNTQVNSTEEDYKSVKINGENFDFMIDCTWGHFTEDPNFYYEPTLLLYYEILNDSFVGNALTLVDGNLFSIYPTEHKSIITLSSVTHTPIGKFKSSAEARNVASKINTEDILAKKNLFEDEVRKFFPTFNDIYAYSSPQIAIKTKPYGSDDDRSCYIKKVSNRKIICLSGKVDNLFYASSVAIDLLGEKN